MNYLLTILHLGELLDTLVVPTLALAHKIKTLFELDPDFKVNVAKLSSEAIQKDDATTAAIAAWKKKLGLK